MDLYTIESPFAEDSNLFFKNQSINLNFGVKNSVG